MKRITQAIITFAMLCTSITAFALDAPTLSVSTSGVKVSLSWTSVSGATGYTLYYAPAPYAGEHTIGNFDMGTNISFSTTLSDGDSYYVAIKAYNGDVETGYSNVELFKLQNSLKFYVEEGIRLDHAAQVYAISQSTEGDYRIFDPSHAGIYLTYKDTRTDNIDDTSHANTSNISFSSDGLSFQEEANFSIDERPGILLAEPDSNGNEMYRKFTLSSEGMTSSTSVDGGKTFIKDDGLRYKLLEEDNSSIGYYDTFKNNIGNIILLYIGAFGTDEANIRLAISEDNGNNFVFSDDNPLNDKGLSSQGLDYRDPRVTMLSDGSLRLFSMVQGGSGAPVPGTKSLGYIYSHTSDDGGNTWSLDEGIRLSKDDFEYDVWSLNDPHVVPLSDGSYRMYVTALIKDDDSSNTRGYKEVIISATTR